MGINESLKHLINTYKWNLVKIKNIRNDIMILSFLTDLKEGGGFQFVYMFFSMKTYWATELMSYFIGFLSFKIYKIIGV